MALATLHALCAMGGSPVEAAAASSGAGGGATPMDTDAEEPEAKEAKEKAAAALLPECISNVSRLVETMLAHHETARLFVERGGMAVMLRLYSLPALAPTLASSAATQVPTPVPVPYTGRADAMMRPSSARAEMTAPPKLDTSCTALSLIPTVNGNTVRSFSTHGQQSAAKGSSGLFDFSALVWSGDGAYLAISLSYITPPPLPAPTQTLSAAFRSFLPTHAAALAAEARTALASQLALAAAAAAAAAAEQQGEGRLDLGLGLGQGAQDNTAHSGLAAKQYAAALAAAEGLVNLSASLVRSAQSVAAVEPAAHLAHSAEVSSWRHPASSQRHPASS
jgi:hypothetical protein